jgi:hypothetical protein
LEAARAIPPAAPAIAAPPATSGTFALLAALPTVWPAPLALSPKSPTVLRTASTFECLLDDPFERDAPLPELRDLPRAFGLAFEAFDFGDDFDFVAGFADFDAEAFLGAGLDLGFAFGVDLVLV